MFVWSDKDLEGFSTECNEAKKPVNDLFSMRRFAKITGEILHHVDLRESFLIA